MTIGSDERRRLLELVLERRGLAAEEELRPREGDVPAPLSPAQERLWFLARLYPGSPMYNVHGAIRFTGPLDVAALDRALAAVVERHEALRTRCALDGEAA